MLILESDCTFVFAVLLSLAVGFEGFETLSFDTVVVLVIVVVVTRCRAASRVAAGMVLWLVVVGLTSTRNIKLGCLWSKRLFGQLFGGWQPFILSLYYRF